MSTLGRMLFKGHLPSSNMTFECNHYVDQTSFPCSWSLIGFRHSRMRWDQVGRGVFCNGRLCILSGMGN